MNAFSSRGSLFALIVGLHLIVLWTMLRFSLQQTVDMPVPQPVVMVEMLPVQPQVQPQPRPPQPEPAPKRPQPVRKAEPVKPAKPVVRAPAPIPTPNTTPSETAIAAPQPSPPAPAAEAPPAPPAPAPVSAPRFDAAYLNNPAPPYPRQSRRMGEQGRVLLRVHVTPEGLAGEVRLQNSSGFTLLDQAALDAVKKWKFVPAKQGGAAVAAWVNVPVDFKID